jgi:hypothetical protein
MNLRIRSQDVFAIVQLASGGAVINLDDRMRLRHRSLAGR